MTTTSHSTAEVSTATPDPLTSSRRILPMLSAASRTSTLESEHARSVRLLLNRGQDDPAGHQRHLITNGSVAGTKVVDGTCGGDHGMSRQHDLMPEEELVAEEESRLSDQFESAALPGDSFPNAGEKLLDAEKLSDDDGFGTEGEGGATADKESDEALLRRLRQSQARMEQIKRMLVTQRGHIVKSLRQVVENRAAAANAAGHANEICRDEEERDRTLGSSFRHSAHKIKSNRPDEVQEEELQQHDEVVAHDESDNSSCRQGGRLCPMCEAAFPAEVDEDAFESHVVEHFCFEEADTLKFVGEEDEEGDDEVERGPEEDVHRKNYPRIGTA